MSNVRGLTTAELPSEKIFVPRTVAPLADEKWWRIGENPCISRYRGTVLPNCFSGGTNIITSIGVISLKKAFDYCKQGTSFDVPTIDGDWHPATIKSFGVQQLYRVDLEGSIYFCTANHQWIIQTRKGYKKVTTLELTSSMKIPYRMCNTAAYTHVISVRATNRFEGVYCAVEPVTHSFTLAGGEITGNCVGYAYGRFSEILGYFHPDLPTCDAGSWIDVLEFRRNQVRLTWGKTPKLGAVAVWSDPRPNRTGHLAVVEYIYKDGTIMLSESGYGSSWETRFWNSGPRSGPRWYDEPYDFKGFIYNPSVDKVTSVAPYDNGIPYGTLIPENSPRYSKSIVSNQSVNLTQVEDAYSPVTNSISADHPARMFVNAAMKHVGRQGYDWVRQKTGVGKQGWSAAMCCAAAIDSNIDSVAIPRDSFYCVKFGRQIVEQYGGTYIVGGAQGGTTTPQIGDIFAVYTGSYSANKYASTRVGIVREVQGDAILTVEGDIQNSIVTNRRNLKDIRWYARPNWIATGQVTSNTCNPMISSDNGTIASLYTPAYGQQPEITYVAASSPLYDSSRSTRADATLREVGFLTPTCEPSINMTDIKLSAINYTNVLEGIYNAVGYSSSAVVDMNVGQTVSVDSTNIQPVNARITFEFLKDRGLTSAQAVGFLACIQRCSSFNTAKVDRSTYACGLLQWFGTRKSNMVQFCGPDWPNTLSKQLDFMWFELNDSRGETLVNLRKIESDTESGAILATRVILQYYLDVKDVESAVDECREFVASFWTMIAATNSSANAISIKGINNAIITKSGSQINSGTAIPIPSSVNQTGIIANYTSYTKFYTRWASGTVQRQLANIWGEQGKLGKYYIATIDGYFLVAVSPMFGNVGDLISVVLDDGTYFNCIIGDAKGSDAQSPYGHVLGSSGVDIIEWEANGESQDALKVGLRQAGWYGKKVVKIVNFGSWING